MSDPIISVIIPLFNRDEYIIETLNSIKDQIFENIEVIIVDDGSEDGSLKACEEVSLKDSRFKVTSRLRHPKGANTCRNIGFERSKGKYIMFLDSDDLLSPNQLLSQISILKKADEFSLCFCKWLKYPLAKELETSSFWKNYDSPIEFLLSMWHERQMTIPGCWLIPREIIEASGLWNEQLLKNQDGEFFLRAVLKSNSILYAPNTNVFYRTTTPGSVSKQKTSMHIKSIFQSIEMYEKYLLLNENSERTRSALAKIYSSFIYEYLLEEPVLSKLAYGRIKSLGYPKPLIAGSTKFNKIAKIFGIDNAIKVTKIKRIFFNKIEACISKVKYKLNFK